MAGYAISHSAIDVPRQESPFRRIVTSIPAPDAEAAFAALESYESRSMHGQLPVIWDRAEGFQVFDRHGNCWIDFTSTIFVTNTGHANPRMRKALRQIIDHGLLHSYTFITDIRLRYHKKLIESVPSSLEKAFLLSAGTEATECALKLMRLQGLKKGKSRGGIICFENAMHGRTVGAAMMGGNPASRAWIGYEDPNMHRFPFPYPWAMDNLTGAQKAQRDLETLAAAGIDLKTLICGIMIEPYQGWGAIFYPEGYVETLADYAKKNDVVLCFDEIQSGFGRTGKWFAYEHYAVEADLICCGKGMSSGFPLSGVLGRADLMDLPDVGSMSSTNSANPLACAAGLATLETFLEEDLVAESQRKGELLKKGLLALQNRFPDRISYVFSQGMVAAVLLKDPVTGRADGVTASRVCERAMQKGLLLVHTGRESIKMGPPLTIPDAALLEGLAVLSDSMSECF